MVASVVGCGDGQIRFEPDRLLHAKNGLSEAQSASIDSALTEWFGTPDEPHLPKAFPQLATLVDLEAIRQAAGPVISHEVGVTQGLYRRHCARCHGVMGNGRGPTARYQAPYPRDFRRGVFKWKSTYRDAPPATTDLHTTLENGIAGTAMPSFRLLSFEERDILRQYVQYLSIRGQVERVLVDYVANELPIDDPINMSELLTDSLLNNWLAEIVSEWLSAETRLVRYAPISDWTADEASLIEQGRELYHSDRAGCAKCHGPKGQGGSVAGKDYEVDYDVWNRDRLIVKPPEAVRRLLDRDLPLRTSRPRQLAGATPHGGGSLADLYVRIHQGIGGTPMPAVGPIDGDVASVDSQSGGLTNNEIQAIAAYVRSLMSIPPEPAIEPTGVATR